MIPRRIVLRIVAVVLAAVAVILTVSACGAVNPVPVDNSMLLFVTPHGETEFAGEVSKLTDSQKAELATMVAEGPDRVHYYEAADGPEGGVVERVVYANTDLQGLYAFVVVVRNAAVELGKRRTMPTTLSFFEQLAVAALVETENGDVSRAYPDDTSNRRVSPLPSPATVTAPR